MALLEIDKINIEYDGARAVRDFSMILEKGEICSIVGESGSGKTSVIRAVFGLLAGGGKINSGEILFNGRSLLKNSAEDWRSLRGRDISMIFQDSGAMMNPTKKIGRGYREYIKTHEKVSAKEATKKSIDMLARMRLPDPENVMNSYPFQLSGGMRQRVGIAMGMTFMPRLLLADEPTSALDVTTQAQIVRQMMELREEYGTSIIIVTHDIGIAAYMSDQIIVMKNGCVEDRGDREHIINESGNTYTRRLIDAVPSLGGERFVS